MTLQKCNEIYSAIQRILQNFSIIYILWYIDKTDLSNKEFILYVKFKI